uniref:GpcrRhopsn4 domain-containing protein n=1 Tax=Rhabditophanes sp. KR3021 TaxID=114890 RepID=A0AC35TGG2_9BILA
MTWAKLKVNYFTSEVSGTTAEMYLLITTIAKLSVLHVDQRFAYIQGLGFLIITIIKVAQLLQFFKYFNPKKSTFYTVQILLIVMYLGLLVMDIIFQNKIGNDGEKNVAYVEYTILDAFKLLYCVINLIVMLFDKKFVAAYLRAIGENPPTYEWLILTDQGVAAPTDVPSS